MSNEKKINVALRSEFGDNASRRLRKSGLIPAVIYGKGKEPRALSVNADEWAAFSAQHSSSSTIVTLTLGDKSLQALVKEVQYNHLKNYFVHIDFLEVDANAEIKASVSLHAFGDCYGASHGGILEQDLHALPVVCRPSELPELIKVDVTALNIGDELKVGQIALPAGVKADVDAETVVFHVIRPKEEVESEAAAEGTEPEAINEKKAEARAEAKKETK